VNAHSVRATTLREVLELLTAQDSPPATLAAVRNLLTDKRLCDACGGTGLQPIPAPEGLPPVPPPPSDLKPSAARLLRDIVAHDNGNGVLFDYRAGLFTHPGTGRSAKRVTFEALAAAELITFAYRSRHAAATDAGRARAAYGRRIRPTP
jgi:hypothetical protein